MGAEMVSVEIVFSHNDNEIKIVQVEHIVSGKPQVEDAVRRLTDQAKAEMLAALNA